MLIDWTRADVDQALVAVVGSAASFVTLVAIFLLGLSLLRSLGR